MALLSLQHVQVIIPSAQAGFELEEAIPIEGRARFFARDPGGNRIEFLAFTRA